VWRKVVQSLTGLAHVTSLGSRCPQPACAFGRTVYRSARAEARQVKGSGYSLDVVVRIGHLRFTEHRTRAEIWRELDTHSPVAISERHVQNLLEVYLALLRASRRDVGAQVAPTVAAHGGIIVALDGLQPDESDAQLWVVREVLSGATLGAAPLPRATADALAGLREPVRAAGVPVLGVVCNAQAAIRLAVAAVFPGVPHQRGQWHALREAAARGASSKRSKRAQAASSGRPSSAATAARTVTTGTGGARSCSLASSAWYSGGSRSARVEATWPSDAPITGQGLSRCRPGGRRVRLRPYGLRSR
jgi:hypothetical protein